MQHGDAAVKSRINGTGYGDAGSKPGKACRVCGAQADIIPIASIEEDSRCPLCGRPLAKVESEWETFPDHRKWLERENPALLDRITRKRQHRNAKERNRRMAAAAAAIVIVGFALYVLCS